MSEAIAGGAITNYEIDDDTVFVRVQEGDTTRFNVTDRDRRLRFEEGTDIHIEFRAGHGIRVSSTVSNRNDKLCSRSLFKNSAKRKKTCIRMRHFICSTITRKRKKYAAVRGNTWLILRQGKLRG